MSKCTSTLQTSNQHSISYDIVDVMQTFPYSPSKEWPCTGIDGKVYVLLVMQSQSSLCSDYDDDDDDDADNNDDNDVMLYVKTLCFICECRFLILFFHM